MIVELDDAPVFVGSGSGSWEAGRPTLVLLHGAGMDRTVWVLHARWFARHGHNVVAPDWPAHGGSGGAVLESVEAQAAWAWRLLDTLRDAHDLPDGELVVAGHSMGALGALAMAAERAGAVERAVLLGVGYPMAVGDALLAAAAANERAAIDMITLFGHGHASRLGRNPVAGISVVNAAAALIARAAPGVLHADLAACHAWRGAEEAAGALGPGRARIIAGTEDRMTPMRATRRLAEILGAEITVIDDGGHMLMSERAEATLEAMREALR